MSQTNLKTRSGNRVVPVFDGKTFGLIQSIRMNDDYAPDAASGVGDIHVQEYVPTQARHSLSVTNMVLIKGDMRRAGIAIVNGDAVLKGMVFDIEVFDKDTGELLTKYIKCSYASGDIEVTKHAIIMNSAQFLALDKDGDGI